MSRRIYPAPDATVDTRSHFLMSRMSGIAGRAELEVFNNYVEVYNATEQTARIAVGNRVELDTVLYKGLLGTADVSVSTGSGQANGLITVSGARRWLCTWHTYTVTNEGYQNMQWADSSGTPILEESGLEMPGWKRRDSGLNNDNNMGIVGWSVIDATPSDIEMEARWVALAGTPNRMNLRVTLYPLGALV